MITFNNLTYTYPNTSHPALRDVTLSLPEGSVALVIGSSGSGKSTLLRCIGGLVPHFSGGTIQGSVLVAGHDPVLDGPTRMSRLVGYVFQDPETQAVMERVEDEIAFGLEQAGIPHAEMRIRVEEVLDLLDLAVLRDRLLESLSGGERQRVAIAAALALRPRVLVLDEPTSQLDPQSAEDVLSALIRLNQDLGLTIILAEHRLERVLPFVDTLIYLDDTQPGALVGLPSTLAAELPLHPPIVAIAKALGWHPTPLTIKAGLVFSRTVARSSSLTQPSARTEQTTAVIDIRGLHISYDKTPALRGVDLAVQPGEVVVLLGRSGSGKSSLLRSLVGLTPAERGQIIMNGQDIRGRETADICRDVAFLPQDPNALLFAETVHEELQITIQNHTGRSKTQQNAPSKIGNHQPDPDRLLKRLGIAALAQRYPRDLSVGERQRVALGAVLIMGAQVLLLDEPTRGLDYRAKQLLADLLVGWRTEGSAILLVTHDVEFAALVATRVVLLARGEIIADGDSSPTLSASPLFAPQAARLFPGTGWLTVEAVLRGIEQG